MAAKPWFQQAQAADQPQPADSAEPAPGWAAQCFGPPAELPEIDIALPDEYADKLQFWLSFGSCVLLGCTIGVVGFGFVTAFERANDWMASDMHRNHYPHNPETWDYTNGQWWWPLWSAGAGLLVGLLRVLLNYPEEVPGFAQEVQEMHCDPIFGWKTGLLGLISLCGGLTIGPEAPLGALGGSLAQFYNESILPAIGLAPELRMKPGHAPYAGMAGAFACIFPSPLLASLIVVELGASSKGWSPSQLWEILTLCGVCSTGAWCVFTGLRNNDQTYLEQIKGTGATGLVLGWDLVYMFYALILGIIAAVLGGFGMLIIVIMTKVVSKIRQAIGTRIGVKVATVLVPVLIGAISGAINIAAPLTFGDGAEQLEAVIENGPEMGVGVLIGSAFLKLVCLGLAQGGGFVGGQFFPLFYFGMTAGVLAHMAYMPSTEIICLTSTDSTTLADYLEFTSTTQEICYRKQRYNGINKYWGAMLMMAAVPAAVAPIPITLVLLVGFEMEMTNSQVSSVFVAVMVSMLLVTGTGMLKKMKERQAAKQAELDQKAAEAELTEAQPEPEPEPDQL